jgi:hypothetical protein
MILAVNSENSIKLVFVMEECSVCFEVRTELLNNI